MVGDSQSIPTGKARAIIYLRKQSGQGRALTDSQPARKKRAGISSPAGNPPSRTCHRSHPRCLCHRHHVTLKCSKNIPTPTCCTSSEMAGPHVALSSYSYLTFPTVPCQGSVLSPSEEEREAQSDKGTPQEHIAEMTELNYKLAVWVQSHKRPGSISLWNTARFCPPA